MPQAMSSGSPTCPSGCLASSALRTSETSRWLAADVTQDATRHRPGPEPGQPVALVRADDDQIGLRLDRHGDERDVGAAGVLLDTHLDLFLSQRRLHAIADLPLEEFLQARRISRGGWPVQDTEPALVLRRPSEMADGDLTRARGSDVPHPVRSGLSRHGEVESKEHPQRPLSP